jgi:threonine/homoserine efflux transporter RhtA
MLYPTRTGHTAAFALVVVAQLLDLATFVPAVARVGIGAESNPFARTLYQSAGPLGPAALKVTAIAIMLLALVRVARRFPTRLVASAAVLAGIGLAGAASNLVFGLLR